MKVYYCCMRDTGSAIINAGFTGDALGISWSSFEKGVWVSKISFLPPDRGKDVVILECQIEANEEVFLGAALAERELCFQQSEMQRKPAPVYEYLLTARWLNRNLSRIRLVKKAAILLH